MKILVMPFKKNRALSTAYAVGCNTHNTPGHDKLFINGCNKKNTAEQLHAVAMDFHNQSSTSSQHVLTRY